ncbi:MAG: PAS domain-containing protein [Ignavibacteria bacterium]|nr:PAS domain-containing protein [Ignavibacteria bacterium]
MKLLFIILIFATVVVKADLTDPHRYSLDGKWNGIAMPSAQKNQILLFKPKPAWNTSSSSVDVISLWSSKVQSALRGSDIRAAFPWRDKVIVVRALEDGAEILVLSDALSPLNSTTITTGNALVRDVPISIKGSNFRNHVFVKIADRLISIEPGERDLRPILVEEAVTGFTVPDSGNYELVIVHDVGGVAYVSMLDSLFRRKVAPAVPLSDKASVLSVDGKFVVVTPLGNSDACQVSIIDTTTMTSQFFSVQIPMHLVAIAHNSGGPVPMGVGMVSGRYELGRIDPSGLRTVIINGTVVPGEFGQPLFVKIIEQQAVLICTGGVLTVTIDGDVLSSDAFEIPIDKNNIEVYETEQGMLISSRRGSVLLVRNDNLLWFPLRVLDTAWKYIVPLALLLIIVLLLIRLRRVREVLDAMIDLPGTGLVLVLDSSGRLFRTNERTSKLLGISKSVPMRRLYRAYLRQRGVENLLAFLEQSLNGMVAVSEKIQINDSDETREYVFTAVPLAGWFGRLRGWVVTGVDITEALERRRIVNWGQLAHDMQTNLSTIRLNAEQLPEEGNDNYRERKRRILFQVGVLIQRVRDLVSVGRSETVDRVFVHSAELCTEIRHEFDPLMFPNVSFSMKLRGTMMNVDRLKISRAVRNAVENGIKALKNTPGTIEIATWFDRTNVYIRVSDDGVGMDTLTLENMMKPHFTTAQDGSGTGIGTMIMQHVVHLHNGSLRVTSEVGIGTQVIFRIPHLIEPPKIRHVQYAVAEEVE